jgi:ribonucleoside-diphosphate reductase beta chain
VIEVSKKKLFSPDADNKIKMFSGDTDNLIDMIDQDLPDFYQRYSEKMFANNWHPHKYPVSEDIADFKNLSAMERKTLDKALSHLSGLDSYQVNNLPEIASRIRYPEVVGILATQAAEESLHSYSYAYIFNTLYSKDEARTVRDLLKTDPTMRNRAIDITDNYENSSRDGSLHTMLQVLLTNLTLEGIMFYNVFNFFFYLKYQGKMTNTAVVISWIKKQELVHVQLFLELLLRFKEDYLEEWDESFIVGFIEKQVELEVIYSTYIIDPRIPGFSKDNIESYTKSRANTLLRLLKIDHKIPNASNPYTHLEKVSNVGTEENPDVGSTETAIFETSNTNYFNPYVKIPDFKEFANASNKK